MTGLPPVILFPYIDLDGVLLRGLLCLFRKVILLQPPFSIASSCTEEAERRGWVAVKRPLAVDLNAEEARRLLREYERLGSLHQDSGYLAYLKHGGGYRFEQEPGYELVREIRRYGEVPAGDAQETLRGLLLLQLAQDLDRQRREIRESLGELGKMEQALQRSIGLDLEDESGELQQTESLPDLEEDDFLIPQRLRAWCEMYQAFKDDEKPFLLTHNHVVVEHLLEWVASETDRLESDGPEALVRIAIPRFVPSDLKGVETIRQTLGRLTPWSVFCEKLDVYLREVRAKGIPASQKGETLARGRALSGYFRDNVIDVLIESVASLELSHERGWQQISFSAILFHGYSPGCLLAGSDPSSHEPGDDHAVILDLEDLEWE